MLNIKNEILFDSGIKKRKEYVQENAELTEDKIINEGLIVFKKSNQLNKFANKIEKRMIRAGDKGKEIKFNYLKSLNKDLRNLATKFNEIEQSFSQKKLTRQQASQKIKSLKNDNQSLLNKLKSQQAKDAFKAIGAVALGTAAIALLGHFGESILNLISTTKTTSASSFYLKMGIEK